MKGADGILAILKGGGKKEREGSGGTKMPETEGEDEGGAFAEAAGKIAKILGVPEEKQSDFANALEAAIYACGEE